MINTITDVLGWSFMLAGSAFFVTAALGLLRFPDLYSRLHAVTKTDTLGLGLLALGLALLDPSWRSCLILLLVWMLVMASGAVNCQLLARFNLEQEEGRHGGDGHQTGESDDA
ncbi:cation:proton antiporter [Pseudohongiella sp.]|uniref:Na+/H+ antiporter subunit n=1 Tax=marine sediment metagenome TaxID=412755 RepID=A0A0F9Z475_9ZZZZ|nr:monovalent cation/H(+) antiporter subunit G [Pseudohongiella sp.]HDZ07893.1 monovalent cation/H(+) antiporter subunit G [Pseudohongiella sp.]HEA64500.1 monovalent cation/H(+) antiporter subunit G [Pseudohongiella sp.]